MNIRKKDVTTAMHFTSLLRFLTWKLIQISWNFKIELNIHRNLAKISKLSKFLKFLADPILWKVQNNDENHEIFVYL